MGVSWEGYLLQLEVEVGNRLQHRFQVHFDEDPFVRVAQDRRLSSVDVERPLGDPGNVAESFEFGERVPRLVSGFWVEGGGEIKEGFSLEGGGIGPNAGI